MDIHVGVDVGGTFTDLAVNIPSENRLIRYKLPSTPEEPDRAIIEGLKVVLEKHSLDASSIVRLSHGTTVGTNALIQRSCGTVAVVTTDGFRDLLEIGRQVRPKVYDIHLDNPKPLVPRHLRIEVSERMRADGRIHVPLDEDAVRAAAQQLVTENVDCVVVCFLHSYAFPAHEERAVEILREELPPEIQVLSSTSVYAEFREYERFSTAVLNGALRTVMNEYLDRFTRQVSDLGVQVEPKVSLSAGGLMSIQMARDLPVRASLSGPAAGVIGGAYRATNLKQHNLITLDVGGTSADVSLLREGIPAEVHDQVLAGFPLRLPALDVSAVGAGGGSIAWIDTDDLLKVGPHSAGADPGPACYGLGAELATVTDANVVLGRLNSEALLDGRMPIDCDLSSKAIAELANRLDLDVTETARGIVRVCCATIVKAIRRISIERGHDTTGFALFAYGGGGPLLAREVAYELGLKKIVVPPSPGILCAEGLLNCDLRSDFVKTALMALDEDSADSLNNARQELGKAAKLWFEGEDILPEQRHLSWTVDLRYKGQNFELSIPLPDEESGKATCSSLIQAFHQAHETSYGFASPAEAIEFVNMKVKAIGKFDTPAVPTLTEVAPAEPVTHRCVVFETEDWFDTPVFRRDALAPGQQTKGPAIIEQLDATTVVYPGDSSIVDDWGNLIIDLEVEKVL
jgi:N-methylhydantoinase A